jgi:nucleoside-diphosphate-sugar epimerase
MFWKNKTVIVTGGAGFLGSFVIEKLQQRGAQQIIVPLIEDYDLTQLPDILKRAKRSLDLVHARILGLCYATA